MKQSLEWSAILVFVTIIAACDQTATNHEPVVAATPSAEIETEMIPAPEISRERLILVTGATGSQGGAVARELLKRGYAVRAFTRNPDSEKARALTALGAEVVQGDFNDPESISSAMAGVDGVFAVTLFWAYGYEVEVEQGKRLIDLAAEAQAGHFLLTSVAAADQATGIPHFESKWEVEQYLHESDLNWTIIRPVEFMDNWNRFAEQFGEGFWVDPRAPGSSHQWIATSDIGFFVAEAFDDPDQWVGVTREIAGDELTLQEFTALLTEAFGHEVKQQQVSWEYLESEWGEELALMIRWFEDVGYDVDVAALRAQYPELRTARDFLHELAIKFGEQQNRTNKE